MKDINHVQSLLALTMLGAWARIFQISIPGDLFEASSNRNNVPYPRRNIILITSLFLFVTLIQELETPNRVMHCQNDTNLSANWIGFSFGFRFWGSRYHTSQTTAQDVISCNKCVVKDCLQTRFNYVYQSLFKLDNMLFLGSSPQSTIGDRQYWATKYH